MDASFWRIVIWASWGGAHGLLNSLFETVLMVADERSLMETIVTFKPDLVIVDLSLPGEREVNIARHLMQHHPDLRLIVLSVHDESTVVTQIRLTGAAGFVLKRTVARDLVAAVQEVLRGGAYVSPAVEHSCDKAGGPCGPLLSDK